MTLSFSQRTVALDACAVDMDARRRAMTAAIAALNQIKADLDTMNTQYTPLTAEINSAGTGDAALAAQKAAMDQIVAEFAAITSKVNAAIAALE